MRKRIGWFAILGISIVLLVIGGARDRGTASTLERSREIAATTKCPVCIGESVGQSNAPASVIIKEEIARQIRAGRSDNEIRFSIASKYSGAIQLTPPATGSASIVWVLPAALLVLLGAVAVRVFRKTSA
jgi:cytochrome c-type biogenesis protein CcmH/NrfF